jgi:hypothetical protein
MGAVLGYRIWRHHENPLMLLTDMDLNVIRHLIEEVAPSEMLDSLREAILILHPILFSYRRAGCWVACSAGPNWQCKTANNNCHCYHPRRAHKVRVLLAEHHKCLIACFCRHCSPLISASLGHARRATCSAAFDWIDDCC